MIRALAIAACGLLVAHQPSFAEQQKIKSEQSNVVPIEGPFEAAIGGVPLLGYVVERPKPGNVTFMLCNNTFRNIEEKLLTPTKANCPLNDRKRNRPGVNPFIVLDDRFVPLWALDDVGLDRKAVAKKFGVEIPPAYRAEVQDVPTGVPAALEFEYPIGRPRLGIIRGKQF